MADRWGVRERIVYDEKPVCVRCSKTITGVVSRTRNGKPLCRDCVFELGERARKPRKQLVIEDKNPPWAKQERMRRRSILVFIGLVMAIFLWRAFSVAPLLLPAQPLRNGSYETDRTTDQCIENLWELSKMLQENRLPETLPLCPRSGRPYTLAEEGEDMVIRCPNPVEHGLEALWVSRLLPSPTLLKGEEE